MRFLTALLGFWALVMWGIFRVYFGVVFDTNCGDYIERAASSPDPTVAVQNLNVAIDYASHHGLTAGNTGIFITYPGNDVGFWFKRLTDSSAILHSLPQGDTPLEVSNTLMRVRETLMASGKDGDTITVPWDISIYPNNAAFFWWGLLSFLTFAAGLLAWLMEMDL
jgi:hypothetical protein